MDFRQANSTPVSRPETAPAATLPPQQNSNKLKRTDKLPKWVNALYVVILFGVAVLIVLLAFSFARSDSKSESSLVDRTQYQAVFLNNSQVYFGNITSISDGYVRLVNVFYLTTQNSASDAAQSTTASDYSLVKLGCQQIHYPYDQMIINRSQVTFWENLNKDGKVVQSIKAFQKQNPNGPDCSKVTSDTQSTNTANTQGGTTTSTETTKQ